MIVLYVGAHDINDIAESLLLDDTLMGKKKYKDACIALSKNFVLTDKWESLFKVTIKEVNYEEDFSYVNEKEILDECAKRLK